MSWQVCWWALIILLIVRLLMAFARIESENRALREEREELRRARQEAEHERLAERAAHRAYEAQFGPGRTACRGRMG